MSIFQKLIAGGPGRPTRLHTERGEIIPPTEFRYLVGEAIAKIRTVVSGVRPDEPWWPKSVIPIIDRLISPAADVLEFGCGGSTIWIARRAKSVISMEDNWQWQSKIAERLCALNLTNASIRYAPSDSYFDLTWCKDRSFDLVIVDGSYRWRCIEAVLPLIRKGGAIYLDNSDADKDVKYYPDPNMKFMAQKLLEQYASQHHAAQLYRHSSIVSGELYAGEGMILTFP
jgi:predicted O-methyltransferase YrrM